MKIEKIKFKIDNPCPKCGGANASVSYVKGYHSSHAEYLERRCTTCRYAWGERCLDWVEE